MRNKNFQFISVFSLLFVAGLFLKGEKMQSNGTLKVVIEGIKSNKGFVGINVFNSADGFPADPKKTVKSEFVTINNNRAEIIVTNLAPGYYAVCAFHDENGNKKMDKNFLGIPKEGFGASNNAKGHFGPPKFNDAKFYIDKPEQTVTFLMAY